MRISAVFLNKFVKIKSMKNIEDLRDIFIKSVNSVDPKYLIPNNVAVMNGKLVINNDRFSLINQCYVVGFGKAVLGMSLALEAILGKYLKTGIVIVPKGILKDFHKPPISSRIHFIEGATNNLPDNDAMKGAIQIKDLVFKLQKDDILIVLISGGGSALLPLPKHPVTLSEKVGIIKELSAQGADIQEINCVRKCLSDLKGGRLALLAYPATVVSLILSDIVGDPLDNIASGPTVPNSDNRNAALNILEKYSLSDTLSHSVKDVLESESKSTTSDVADSAREFAHVHNYIIGNNSIATRAALEQATALGYTSFVLSTKVTGEVHSISKIYAELAHHISATLSSPEGKKNLGFFLENIRSTLKLSEVVMNELLNVDLHLKKNGICIILGGELTVVVNGKGRGGRNQELALAFSIDINKLNIKSADISFLSCGTDGIDGPTDAAGAVGHIDIVNEAMQDNIDPVKYLKDNDSYNFYSTYNGGSHLIRTGHTGTNVMDIHILLISPKKST